MVNIINKSQFSVKNQRSSSAVRSDNSEMDFTVWCPEGLSALSRDQIFTLAVRWTPKWDVKARGFEDAFRSTEWYRHLSLPLTSVESKCCFAPIPSQVEIDGNRFKIQWMNVREIKHDLRDLHLKSDLRFGLTKELLMQTLEYPWSVWKQW